MLIVLIGCADDHPDWRCWLIVLIDRADLLHWRSCWFIALTIMPIQCWSCCLIGLIDDADWLRWLSVLIDYANRVCWLIMLILLIDRAEWLYWLVVLTDRADLLHSLQSLRCRPCWQMPLPPHSLHLLRCRPCWQEDTGILYLALWSLVFGTLHLWDRLAITITNLPTNQQQQLHGNTDLTTKKYK